LEQAKALKIERAQKVNSWVSFRWNWLQRAELMFDAARLARVSVGVLFGFAHILQFINTDMGSTKVLNTESILLL
jgi:hypothetical protein